MKNRYDGVDERIVLNVRICARNLKRSNLPRSMEIEDLEQELMREALLGLRAFDERRGNLDHFVRKVLARRSKSLLKHFRRKKRGPFVNFKEYEESKIDESRNGDFAEINERLLDLDGFIERLPSEYKTLCRLLTKHSISEAAKIIGKSRASLRRDLKRVSLLANRFSNSEGNTDE